MSFKAGKGIYRLYYALIVLAMVGLDYLVKLWAKTQLQPVGSIPVIKDVFHLTYAENRGAAFGILQGQQTLFLVITAVVVIALITYLFFRRKTISLLPGMAMALLIAGAIGNLIDRALQGYVVDMFDFRLINFAIFNVADSCVSVAAVGLIAYILFGEVMQRRKPQEAQ